MQELHVPGAGLALIDHGEVIWTKGYGVEDKTTGKPVTPETVFQAGSISKPVTAWGSCDWFKRGSCRSMLPSKDT